LGGTATRSRSTASSKAYGMASWRVGFLVAPEHLFDDLIKIQDTVIVCAPAVSQAAALESMRVDGVYCRRHLESIAAVRRKVLARLSGEPDLLSVPESEGAFYFFAKVRTEMDDLTLTERLVREHKVAVIPGGTFGVAGSCSIRIAYGSLSLETARRRDRPADPRAPDDPAGGRTSPLKPGDVTFKIRDVLVLTFKPQGRS